jgi:hypothetical protein
MAQLVDKRMGSGRLSNNKVRCFEHIFFNNWARCKVLIDYIHSVFYNDSYDCYFKLDSKTKDYLQNEMSIENTQGFKRPKCCIKLDPSLYLAIVYFYNKIILSD